MKRDVRLPKLFLVLCALLLPPLDSINYAQTPPTTDIIGSRRAGEGILFIVRVDSSVPPVDTYQIVGDFTAIGWTATEPFQFAPEPTDPGRYTWVGYLPLTMPPGAVSLPVTVRDPAGNTTALTLDFVALPPTDTDNDTLPDVFEQSMGLDPSSAAGDHGAAGDPDGDGLTNEQELAGGTHPRGFFTRYFAEGATGSFFDTSLALLNADPVQTARTAIRFERADGSVITFPQAVDPLSRVALPIDTAVRAMLSAEFGIVIESDLPVIADRTMTWDRTGYGSHTETSIPALGTTWHLAEGATHSGFNLFYLLENPNATATNVTITYLLAGGAPPLVKNYVLQPASRFNVWVNVEDPVLASAEMSALITADQPIAVERAMYLDLPGQTFGAGHGSAAVAAPSDSWVFAEGATGSYFDLFILLANPNGLASEVEATYYLPNGTTFVKNHTVPPNSRYTIWVDLEDATLADTAVATALRTTNGVPFVAERAMWWPGPTAATWFEAHNSPGAATTALRWGVADAEVAADGSTNTYILIANVSAAPATVRVTTVQSGGVVAEQTFPMLPTSRLNIDVAAQFPGLTGGFGVIVESLPNGGPAAQILVERSVYSNAGGVTWAAGRNALATPIP